MKIPIHRLVLSPIRRGPRGPDGLRQHYLGETTFHDRTIVLDPRGTTSLARVYLHELIHLQHQGWSETRVLKEESRRWRRMRWSDKARLYRALGKARIENWDE